MSLNHSPRFVFVVCFVLILFSSCKKDNEVLCDPTPVFDIDLFVENVLEVLNDDSQQVSGYQFVVSKNGNKYFSDADGFERHQNDNLGERLFTENTYMNVASVSKFIGAIALLHALEKRGLDIDDPIYPYLPERWQNRMDAGYKVKPDINNFSNEPSFYLTFRKILQMQTGIPFPPADNGNVNPGQMPTTDEMLRGLSTSGNESLIGTYQNGNFTLIRVLIGEMEYQLNDSVSTYNLNTANAYFTYLKDNIFDPLNINNPLLSVNSINSYFNNNNHVMAYQYPFNVNFTDGSGRIGWPADNTPEDNGGSGGLMLNATEIAKIAAYLKHDNAETLLSAAYRNDLLNNELGLIESTDGKYGRYQSKGGTRGADGNSRALRSRVMFFPNDVEAVLLVNCNYTTMGTLLRSSYDSAWVNPCK